MLDHLLLPLDGSQLAECVLPHAAALAAAFNARLTVLRVLEKPATPGQAPAIDPVSWHLSKAKRTLIWKPSPASSTRCASPLKPLC